LKQRVKFLGGQTCEGFEMLGFAFEALNGQHSLSMH
jgi:hypothetical protein